MAIAIDSEAGVGYVADTEHMVDGKNLSHTVSTIDLKTNKVTGQIDVGSGPFDIAIADDKIFTSNSGEWKLAAISKKDHKIIKKVAVIDTPLGIAVSPDKKKVYVAVHGKGSVMVFDAGEVKELSTVKVGNSAWYIAVDSKNNKAYVTKGEENAVSVIDTTSDKVIGSINVGKAPRGVAVDSEANRAYVVNHADISVSVIDTTNDKVIGTIKLTPATESSYSGSPWGIVVN
jgi:YVTN family beta-propeller protein